jgi:hypothetical protein
MVCISNVILELASFASSYKSFSQDLHVVASNGKGVRHQVMSAGAARPLTLSSW